MFVVYTCLTNAFPPTKSAASHRSDEVDCYASNDYHNDVHFDVLPKQGSLQCSWCGTVAYRLKKKYPHIPGIFKYFFSQMWVG